MYVPCSPNKVFVPSKIAFVSHFPVQYDIFSFYLKHLEGPHNLQAYSLKLEMLFSLYIMINSICIDEKMLKIRGHSAIIKLLISSFPLN